jgi:hypothetical protein
LVGQVAVDEGAARAHLGGMNVDLVLAVFCAALTVAIFAAPQMMAVWTIMGIAAAIIAYAVSRQRRR